MKKITFGLIGALAVATTVMLVRQQKQVEQQAPPPFCRSSLTSSYSK